MSVYNQVARIYKKKKGFNEITLCDKNYPYDNNARSIVTVIRNHGNT
jgi:hypothetical protein